MLMTKILNSSGTMWMNLKSYGVLILIGLSYIRGAFSPSSFNFFLFFSPDASRILLDIGFGFFLEMTHPEALSFIDEKIPFIQSKVEKLTTKICTIKANIKMVLEVCWWSPIFDRSNIWQDYLCNWTIMLW